MRQQEPKYILLINWIREKISTKELRPGSKLYSENELSAMFGVSRQTVRHAIGILETEGLVERVRGALDGRFGRGEKLLYGEPWSGARTALTPGFRTADKQIISLCPVGDTLHSSHSPPSAHKSESEEICDVVLPLLQLWAETAGYVHYSAGEYLCLLLALIA